MCASCQINQSLISKKIPENQERYSLLSIRSCNNKNLIFTAEHMSITQPGDKYWSVPGLHLCGCCMRREIIVNQISWIEHDYTSCGITFDGKLVSRGNELMSHFLKLKAFL
jgi:hypothetical protein